MDLVSGVRQLEDKIREMSEGLSKRTFQAVTVAGYRVHRTALELISQVGTGRTYKLSHPTRTHTAASPGQPPATDTGALKQSLTVSTEQTMTGAVCSVSSDLPYAADLEYGTNRMGGAHPWLLPAFLVNEEDNKQSIREAFKEEVLKGAG